MNGAQSLIRTLTGSGVNVCFANPGTSEMHFVAALDAVPEMRAVLTLFEGVATGAADGYGRMTGKPACTLLHLGPGFANGAANLHNARRARTPIVNIVGDHATHHRAYETPLASDVEGLARWVSGWVHTSTDAKSVGADAARAVVAALEGRIATLILPANAAWENADGPAAALEPPSRRTVPGDAIERAGQALRNGKRSVLLVGGNALTDDGLAAAGRIATATGARAMRDTIVARIRRGAGTFPLDPIPYLAEDAVPALRDTEQLILAGTGTPVAFFAYPGKPSWLLPEHCEILELSRAEDDSLGALEALAGIVGPPPGPVALPQRTVPDLARGDLDGRAVACAVARFLPENAIVSDESVTSGPPIYAALENAVPHDHLFLTGGAIGQGIPVALGAAIACPDRKVVCLEGDGSALYTLQALWTLARENLDVTTVLFNNRSYGILNIELSRVGAQTTGPRALEMLSLEDPSIRWVDVARGLGVEAFAPTTAEEFNRDFEAAMTRRGPCLVEVGVEPPPLDFFHKWGASRAP